MVTGILAFGEWKQIQRSRRLAHAMAECASVRATYDRSRFRTVLFGEWVAIDLAVFLLNFFRLPELIVSLR
jgi:hypothetical protein